MKLALVGYGRMGHEVERLAPGLGHDVVARIDAGDDLDSDLLNGAEAAIEFTAPGAAAANLLRLAELGVDVACGTTGWHDAAAAEEIDAAARASGAGIVWAPNFSLGVALFSRIVRRAAELADALPQYDVHLAEAHHRHKTDAPSGTARMLADLLVTELSSKDSWSLPVHGGTPHPRVLEVSAARAGEIPGTHTVALEGPHDRIVLTHDARSRGGFARGALEAAEWVRGKAGFFTLDDWLAQRFQL